MGNSRTPILQLQRLMAEWSQSLRNNDLADAVRKHLSGDEAGTRRDGKETNGMVSFTFLLLSSSFESLRHYQEMHEFTDMILSRECAG